MEYKELRKRYCNFVYHGYHIFYTDEAIEVIYDFEIEDLKQFHPTLKIRKSKRINENRKVIDQLVFHIGLIELISYWKCTCSPNVFIKAGYLDEKQIKWFKKLYFNGLGEFFYLNHINTNESDFMNLIIEHEKESFEKFAYSGLGNLILVGGGKDSIVSLEILKKEKNNSCFILNPKEVTLSCCEIASIKDDDVITVDRIIDSNLLALNKEGFLNGHTPLSALLTFLAYLIAYLENKQYIILSNENSANQSTVIGTDVNHQYSKTYEFEMDFFSYSKTYLPIDLSYFSLLRPLNEYQIACLFSKYEKYHKVFKSCNLGSKDREWKWCCNCPKCLFIYIILSPFLYKNRLVAIFGEDLFQKQSLLPTFLELLGIGEHKPFECVGTTSEVNYAVMKCITQLKNQNKELPFLLDYFEKNHLFNKEIGSPLKEYNLNHHLPEYFEKLLKKELNHVLEVD